jgi:hypothetical protein
VKEEEKEKKKKIIILRSEDKCKVDVKKNRI